MGERIVVHTDGGCRNNPGAGSWGFVIAGDGWVQEDGGFLPHTTNNFAEMTAIAEAARQLASVSGAEIEFRSDSMLCVKLLNHEWTLRNESLRAVFLKALFWIEALSLENTITVRHIRREFNKEADAICNRVMDEHGVVGVAWKNRQHQTS